MGQVAVVCHRAPFDCSFGAASVAGCDAVGAVAGDEVTASARHHTGADIHYKVEADAGDAVGAVDEVDAADSAASAASGASAASEAGGAKRNA